MLPAAYRLPAALVAVAVAAWGVYDLGRTAGRDDCAARIAAAAHTASQAIKKAARLEVEIDKAMQYATVKRMEMLYHGQKFNWRLLKSTATQMDMPPIDVFDSNYGTVKAYHADVWREAYALEIPRAVPDAA